VLGALVLVQSDGGGVGHVAARLGADKSLLPGRQGRGSPLVSLRLRD
jgi:hypothetical protein